MLCFATSAPWLRTVCVQPYCQGDSNLSPECVTHPIAVGLHAMVDTQRPRDRAGRRLDVLRQQLTTQPASAVGPSCTACSSCSPLLQGKVAVITGSGQGIGAEAARMFALQGAAVVVSDLDGAKAQQVAQGITQQGGRAIAVQGDVTDADFPQRLVDAAMSAFGAIDILVNNAGFTWDAVIHKMTAQQWQTMLDVHCTAPFRLIQAVAPVMREAGKKEREAGREPCARHIINVSSVSGTRGSAGQANYSTAKMGVVGLTKTVAREWGQFGIRCNALAYGKIQTRLVAPKEQGNSIMVNGQEVRLGIPAAAAAASVEDVLVPLGRSGSVQEAAGAMLLLVTPWANYITGQVLEVNGGLYT